MGRILIVEFSDADNPVFEEIMQLLHHSSGFSELSVADTFILSVPGLEINLQQRRVYCNNLEIHFTVKEYNILCLLVANKGQTVTYNQIYQRVWGDCSYGKANGIICYHILNIRKKFAANSPILPFEIVCKREIGYCFNVLEEENKMLKIKR